MEQWTSLKRISLQDLENVTFYFNSIAVKDYYFMKFMDSLNKYDLYEDPYTAQIKKEKFKDIKITTNINDENFELG